MSDKKKFPVGTKVQNWSLFYEKQKGKVCPVIRRWVKLPDGTKLNERLPAKEYALHKNNPVELEKLVIRLNGAIPEELKRRQKLIIQHAYIDPPLLEKYYDVIRARVPNKQNVSKEFGYLNRYFLHFFIHRLNMANPLEWHLNQEIWCWALLNDFPKDKKKEELQLHIWERGHYPAEKTVKEIVQSANRFMAWLHQRRPLDAKPLVFEPISKAQFKSLTATRERLGLVDDGQFISDSDWETIEKNLTPEIKPMIMLAYHYGLRRAESLGILMEDLLEDNVEVRHQLAGIDRGISQGGAANGKPRYDNLKGRMARKIPHWFADPNDTYEWLDEIYKKKLLVHPDTLTDRWNEVMEALGMDYGIHDLRHTWCTKAAMKYTSGQLMLAAGHENIETTMKYFHDSRELSKKRFVPTRKKSA